MTLSPRPAPRPEPTEGGGLRCDSSRRDGGDHDSLEVSTSASTNGPESMTLSSSPWPEQKYAAASCQPANEESGEILG